MAATSEPSQTLLSIAGLLREDQGRVLFPRTALPQLRSVIDTAAHLPDSGRGAGALLDVVRFWVALRKEGHFEAAKVLEWALTRSPAALDRLEELRNRAESRARAFQALSGETPARMAPSVERPRQARGIELHRLLPPHRLSSRL